jgi:hypothetical protein
MPHRSLSVEAKITEVGRDLARAFTGVLDALPGGPPRPQWLARLLGVNIVLTSRLIKAAQQHDPLAVAHIIPGPEPLRRLLRAAEKKKIDPALIQDARAVVDRFERLIESEAGDRSSLDAIISGWLPDAREKIELLAKQSVYRGISQLLGTACDVEHYSAILYPSAQFPHRADQLWIIATRGLRRVRPGWVVKYETVHSDTPMLTVTGQPLSCLDGIFLEQFCSKPLPHLHVCHLGDRVQYTLVGDDVGVQSGVDLVHSTLLPGKKPISRGADEPPQKTAVSIGIAMPSKTLVFDLLLHVDIYPGQHPTFNLYRTESDGAVDPNDASRDVDRLDVMESIQPLGQGIAKFRAADTPAYQDMIRYVCEMRAWDVTKLRGYRCRIEYPMYSSQVVFAFDLPPRN